MLYLYLMFTPDVVQCSQCCGLIGPLMGRSNWPMRPHTFVPCALFPRIREVRFLVMIQQLQSAILRSIKRAKSAIIHVFYLPGLTFKMEYLKYPLDDISYPAG